MKLLFCLLALPFVAPAQALLTNAGSVLTVPTGATLTVGGGLLNQSGGTLTSAGRVLVGGDLTNTATLTSSGQLLFIGAGPQTLAPGASTISRLHLSNTGPATSGQNVLTVAASLTITDSLVLNQGLVRAPAGVVVDLAAAAGLAGEAPGRYVQGSLRTQRPAVSGFVDFGLGFTLDASGQSLGTVTVTRTAGLKTPNLSYGQNVGGTTQGIDRIYTVSSQQAPSTPLPLTLAWLPDDDNGLTDFSQATPWRQAAVGAPWAASGPAQNASATRQVSASAAALGRFTVSNAASPLPVVLVSFTAEPLGSDALLKWTTASERDNAYFEVEVSADGRVFRRIGQVAGHGTTTQAHDYRLVDPAIAHYGVSLVYYRLRQVDLNGTATFSPVRAVAVGQSALALFPNPTSGATTLVGTAAGASVTVLDAVGRLVLATTADATGTAPLALPEGLAAGVYLVRTGPAALRLTVE